MILSLPHTILMTADTVGGVWTYALELCRSLRRYDMKIHLATMGNPLDQNQWKAAKKLSNLEVHESSYALEWMEDPWKEVEEAEHWLLKLERQIQPDLIHLNNYVHGSLPWNAPVLLVGHSCVLSWWKAVKGVEAPDKWNRYASSVKKGLRRADTVVSVSKSMLKQLKHYYGPFTHSRVIYNGRDANNFYTSHKKPLIFSMGRIWDEAKNIAVLGEIAAALPWPVEVAGDGEQSLSNQKNFTYLGKQSPQKVAAKLSHCSIYVMPARYEPFGLSILEAALSGCALVLGNIASLKEIWREAAIYADPGNCSELKAKIQLLIRNDAFRKKMAEKAKKRASCYSMARSAGQYVEVYQEMLSSKYRQSSKNQSYIKNRPTLFP